MDFFGTDKISFRPVDDKEFGIYTDLARLPLSEYPSYLKHGIGGVCLSGTATLQVFNSRCRLRPKMIVVLLPWQLASIKEVSDDFRITFFCISQEMFTDCLSSLWRLTPEFYFYMRSHFVSAPDEGNIQRFLHYCGLLSYRALFAPENCRRESIMQLLRVFYWDVYVYFVNDPQAQKAAKYTRKEELAFQFMRLIIEGHEPNAEVACYAEKLGVSPKYLTTLIKNISGQSAREWIVDYTLLELKALLRESALDLKSVAARANFPDQSSMCRYFRRYTGMTPSQYRKQIHF